MNLREKAKSLFGLTRAGITAKAPAKPPITLKRTMNALGRVMLTTSSTVGHYAGSILDAAIAIVSPSRAFNRQQVRQMIQRSYEASNQTRLNADVDFSRKNADTETRYRRMNAMAVSREEMRNHPFYSNALRTSRNNVIGDDESNQGMNVHATIKDKSGELRKDLNDEIDSFWEFYKNKLHLSGQWTFNELVSVFHNSYKTSGEVLAVMRDYPSHGSDLPLSIEDLEPEHLPTTGEAWSLPFAPEQSLPNGNMILDGIERDAMKRIVGYHILKFHPGDEFLWSSLVTDFFPVERVIHYYEPLRPEQSRGMPYAISGLQSIEDEGKTIDNELKRQKVQAQFGVHFTKPPGSFLPGAQSPVEDAQGRPVQEFQAGMITTGPQKAEMYGSGTPNAALGPFLKHVGHREAASLNMSYSSTTKDYSEMSFNSGRLEHREDWRSYQFDQGLHVRNLVKRKLWPAFINALIVANKLTAFSDLDLAEYARTEGDEGYDPRVRANFESCEVTMPESEYVNPEQEGKADDAAVAAGYKCPSDVVGKKNFEEHIKKWKQDFEVCQANGVHFSWMDGFTVGVDRESTQNDLKTPGEKKPAKPMEKAA